MRELDSGARGDRAWGSPSLTSWGRGEAPSSGTTPPKSAPGFGIGRARGDLTVVGFAIGRGRANFTGCGILQWPPLHSTIGSSYLVDKGDRGHEDSNAFHYPRVKLLDIYQTIQTLPSFAKYPDGFMEVQLLTQGKISEPLAFIIPDKEEEVRNHVMLER
jgi:hypothetical protein